MILLSVKLNVEPLGLQLDRCLGVSLRNKAETSSIKLELELLSLELLEFGAVLAEVAIQEDVVEVDELAFDEDLGFLSFLPPQHPDAVCFCRLQSHQTLNASLQKYRNLNN